MRFAFSPQKIGQLTASAAEKCAVEGTIDSLGDGYELRRLRQGYIYIYAQKTFKEDKTSDEDGVWKVFKYVTDKSDANSSSVRKDVINTNEKSETFHCYTWLDGHAGGVWKDVDSKVYPYAFVSLDCSIIDIAYSEERWPSWFFYKCQNEPAFRHQIMQTVDLQQEQSTYSCSLGLLTEKVADFIPDIIGDVAAQYAGMQTGLKHQALSSVAYCEHSKLEGKIIALHDPIGKILEIKHRLLLASQKQHADAAKSQYPLTIARFIDQVKPSIDESFTWFKDMFDEHPVRGNQWQKYLDIEMSYQQEVNNLVAAFDATLNHQHIGDFQTLLANSLDGLPDKIKKDRDIERLTFATLLLQRSIFDLDCTHRGQQMLLASWSGATKNSNKILRKFLSSTVSYWSKTIDIKLIHFEAFDLLVHSSATQLAQIAVKQPNNAALKAVMNTAKITKLSRLPVPADKAADILSGKISGDFLIVKEVQTHTQQTTKLGNADISSSLPSDADIAAHKTSTRVRGAVVSNTTSDIMIGSRKVTTPQVSMQQINMLHVENASHAAPAAGFHTAARKQFSERLSAAGVATFLGYYTLFDLIDKRNAPSQSGSPVGRFVDKYYIAMTVQFVDSFAATFVLGSKITVNGSVQQLSKNLTAKLAEQVIKNNKVSETVAKQVGNSAKGMGMARIGMLAKTAGYLGVALSLIKSGDAFYSDKNAAGTGNLLMAVGGAVMIYFGASGIGILIGLLLIIVGGLTEMFGSLSELEQWAKDSFWGSSDEYWGDLRSKDMQDELSRSLVLSNSDHKKHKEVKTNFEKEVIKFENLFSGFGINRGAYRGFSYTVIIPRASEGEFKLNIEMVLDFDARRNPGNSSLEVINGYKLVGFDYEIDYATNQVKVNFRNALPPDLAYINKIKVIADYTDPNGKAYPQATEILYNRTGDLRNNHKWKL